MASISSDNWKSLAKESVNSLEMNVKGESYLVRTHNVTQAPKTGNALLELIEEDINYLEREYEVQVIACCTDDGPDGKKARRLLGTKRPELVVPACWAHQINLVVGEYLKLKVPFIEAAQKAIEVIKWFNHHYTALALLQKEQELTEELDRIYALILPALTRWISHYLALYRLEFLEKPIKLCAMRHQERLTICAGDQEEHVQKAKEILAIITDEGFWKDLKKMRIQLEPLAIAANIMQAERTRLNHVLLALANLFRIYGAADIDDQVPYILAAFFNPYIHATIFNRSNRALTKNNLLAMAETMYKRFFNQEPNLDFQAAFLDYYDNTSDLSSDNMRLSMYQQMATREKKELDLIQIWAPLNSDGTIVGRNGLVQLAIRILSIVANSAGIERIFSCKGIIQTARRTRLHSDKVHKTVVLKQDLHRRHSEAGLLKPRQKRKFGALDISEPSDDEEDVANFRSIATVLINDATAADGDTDSDSDDNDHDDTPLPRRTARQPFFREKDSFKLANLFDLSDPARHEGPGLSFYWRGGIEKIAADMYELEFPTIGESSVAAGGSEST
ncbi:hypothetical protein JAAARDRAFT_187260 [Jaapia argillacea MUCL 33604]|uniref:Uncharacterized protein n=1 Tax=Jaapia argillacea MUCL 33604 TaxID=933084 RepID=A0A067PD74_9AGAM|nr:hypothetical protein JAAARDRAFT_187260 [Jaapia argillacea MUCL 33604]